MGCMNGGRNVNPGSRTHPGTNAGAMHAGIVVRRMLKFMRDRTTGRHRQEGNDGEGDNPHNAFEAGTSHMTKTET